jgi:hypothetical protein
MSAPTLNKAMRWAGYVWRCIWIAPLILAIALLALICLVGFGPMMAIRTIDAVID